MIGLSGESSKMIKPPVRKKTNLLQQHPSKAVVQVIILLEASLMKEENAEWAFIVLQTSHYAYLLPWAVLKRLTKSVRNEYFYYF